MFYENCLLSEDTQKMYQMQGVLDLYSNIYSITFLNKNKNFSPSKISSEHFR